MNLYDITLSVCTTLAVEAHSKEEAIQIMKDSFKEGRQELIDAIDTNGFEIEIED